MSRVDDAKAAEGGALVDLDALEAATRSVTPGPWHVVGREDYYARKIDDTMIVAGFDEEEKFVCNMGPQTAPIFNEVGGAVNLGNAEAVVLVINSLPALVAELRALREVRDAAQAFVELSSLTPLPYGKAGDLDCAWDALKHALAKVRP